MHVSEELTVEDDEMLRNVARAIDQYAPGMGFVCVLYDQNKNALVPFGNGDTDSMRWLINEAAKVINSNEPESTEIIRRNTIQ